MVIFSTINFLIIIHVTVTVSILVIFDFSIVNVLGHLSEQFDCNFLFSLSFGDA